MDIFGVIEEIYSECIEYISSGDLDSYRVTLGQIPIAELPMRDQRDTLMFFLTVCYRCDRLDGVIQTFDVFDEANPMSETRPTFATFFVSAHDEDINFIRFVASAFPDIDFYDVVSSLLHYEGEDEIIQACLLAEICYGTQEADVFKALLLDVHELDNEGTEYNDGVLRYIERVLMEMKITSERPAWIINFHGTDLDLIKLADEVQPSYHFHPSDTTLASMIGRASWIDSGIEPRNINELLMSLPEEERQKLSDLYANAREQLTLSDSSELNRIFGPSYPFIRLSTLSPTSDDPCDRYGGCRMLLCLGHDEDFTETGPVESEGRPDWFTEYCDVCMAYIPERHYACRAIGPFGGYRGCCCSREHARTLIDQTNLVQVAALDEIEKKIDDLGIYERTYEKPDYVSHVDDSGMTFDDLANYV